MRKAHKIICLLVLIVTWNVNFANIFNLPSPFGNSIVNNSIDGKYYRDHWQYLNRNFSWLTDEPLNFQHPDVKKQLEYLSKNQLYMKNVSQRAQPYLFYVSKEIYKRNLPAELALLPIVESAFNPFANSSAGASGLWQIMPNTARFYGLELNWWYDGRRDIVRSTDTALNYIENLYNYLNQDWLLTIAAYNSGLGTVQRAIKYNKSINKDIDFWSLRLPKETKNYIPKLLAFIKVVNNPQKYNQNLISIPHKPYFDIVDLSSQIDLKLAAQLSEVSLEDIYTLNPGFNRFATAPDGPRHLVLPVKNSGTFVSNLSILDDSDLVSYEKYTIQTGDTLSGIAKKFETTIDILKKLNDLATNTININTDLIIPVRAA